jgi:four helix bundle protein
MKSSVAKEKQPDLKKRTKAFAVEVVKFAKALPKEGVSMTLGKQLLRSGTSVGANYRSARRGRSTAEFIAKLGIVEEEADRSLFGLEVMVEAGIAKPDEARPLWQEANELLSITVAAIKTSRTTPTAKRARVR